MSNVVGFLPDNIPRILINRDIVQVKRGSQTNGTDANNFCLWDACLLGNCDAVTKAIVEGGPYHLGRLVTHNDDDNGMCLMIELIRLFLTLRVIRIIIYPSLPFVH